MPVARSAKRWLAPAAKTHARRVFWRPKCGIFQRDRDAGVVAVGDRIRTRPAQARNLASMFDAVGAAVRIEGVTLSDKPRVTAMRTTSCSSQGCLSGEFGTSSRARM
jgi:hypothetical protein